MCNTKGQIYGLIGALIELGLFFVIATWAYQETNFDYDKVSYYWMTFTVLTGIWEAAYVIFHGRTIETAQNLITFDHHAWFQKYSVTMILPWNLSVVFYAEYAAWADREYMSDKDLWSRLIESTHALFCGIFSGLAFMFKIMGNDMNFKVCLAISMGSQLMNSVLYMGEYRIQTKDPESPNFDTPDFPCGRFYSKRLFMWINIFWSVMPAYLIVRLLV